MRHIIEQLEYTCHDGGGATAIAYSRNNKQIISGGKKGELCILHYCKFDVIYQYYTRKISSKFLALPKFKLYYEQLWCAEI